MNRLRHLAPAGAPIRARDLVAWSRRLFAADDPRAALGAAIRSRTGLEHCSLVSTGRAALTIILDALRDLAPPNRDEVIVPSYTCFSVPASVMKAGLHPRVADIDPATLDYDPDRLSRLDTGRTLALVATNLYGLPNDMPRLSSFAAGRGLFLVDDAAQALGATVGGRPSGSWGDAGLFSFDKGKNVSAIDGGAIVTRSSALAAIVRSRVDRLPSTPAADVALALVKVAAYMALLPPSRYWLPARIPGLGLGTTVYDTTFRVDRYARPLAALALTQLAWADNFLARRRANAKLLAAGLAKVPGVSLIHAPAGAEGAHLRLPILVADRRGRAAVIAAVNRATGGATASYPTSVADVPALAGVLAGTRAEASGGRHVAERIVTLPTHPYVSEADVRRIVAAVAAAAGRTAAAGRPATVEAR